MKKVSRTSMVLISIMVAGGGFAAAQDLDGVIKKTSQRYRDMKSFYTEFTQTLCDEQSGSCFIYEGKLYFLKPNFFRMEIEKPAQVYVGDSASLWIYMPDKKRAVRQAMGQVPFAVNANMFLEGYEDRFNAGVTSGDDGYEITLTPKEQSDIFEKITLLVDPKKFDILSISIVDEAGSENKFIFSSTRINKKISRDIFKFQPPPGTEIIEE